MQALRTCFACHVGRHADCKSRMRINDTRSANATGNTAPCPCLHEYKHGVRARAITITPAGYAVLAQLRGEST